MNTLNPDFTTSMKCNYFFEKEQNLKFVMIDGDGDGDYDTIGELNTTMGSLMGARAQMFTGTLTDKHGNGNRGQIIVRTEAIQESNEAIAFSLSMREVNNMGGGCMGMCDEQFPWQVEVQKEVPQSQQYVNVANIGMSD